MASYLGRNVNLALLVIIIGVVIALVGTTVFYQRGLQNRTIEFEETSEGLQQCQTALANYQDKYSQAEAKAEESAQDIRKYDDIYEQKVAELKDTQGQLLNTQQQMQFERLQKEKFQSYYESQLTLNNQLNNTVKSLQNQVTNLRAEVEDLEDALDACGG